MFTLKSALTNRYISSLFSDKHTDTFNAPDIDSAYQWEDQIIPYQLSLEIGQCIVVDCKEEIVSS